MARALMILMLSTITAPAFAADSDKAASGETVEVFRVDYRTPYVEGVQQRIRAKQASRRAALKALAKKKQIAVRSLPREQQLLTRTLMLPPTTDGVGVASR
ncbi:MAG: hypothetical protein AAFY60_08540 [Myxococcota bacterium]